MADATTEVVASVTNGESSVTTGNTEDFQNQQNENSENKLVEDGSEETGMEVDGVEAPDSAVKVEETESSGEKCDVTSADYVEETQREGEDGSEIQVKTEKQGVEEDTKVKTEAGKDGGDRDTYMVLEEADGDDNESNSSEEEELTENERLRRANYQLNERLALLEEFIEVEFSDKFEKFMSKRERLVDVVGLGQKYDSEANITGKRSAKSLELTGLLKIVNDQAKTNRRIPWKNKSPLNQANSSKSTTAKAQTGMVADVGVKKDREEKSTASASTTNQIRCHRCKATGHLVRQCPLPIDPRDRRIILRREARKDKKQRDREEGEQYPQLKALRDKRRRIGRAFNRERQKIINPWATGL